MGSSCRCGHAFCVQALMRHCLLDCSGVREYKQNSTAVSMSMETALEVLGIAHKHSAIHVGVAQVHRHLRERLYQHQSYAGA